MIKDAEQDCNLIEIIYRTSSTEDEAKYDQQLATSFGWIVDGTKRNCSFKPEM